MLPLTDDIFREMDDRFTTLGKRYRACHWKVRSALATSRCHGIGNINSHLKSMPQARSNQHLDIMLYLLQDKRGSSSGHIENPGRFGPGVTVASGPSEIGREVQLHSMDLKMLTEKECKQTNALIEERHDGTRALIEEQGTQLQTLITEQRSETQACRRMLTNLRAETYDTPRLACVLRPWEPFDLPEGLSSREQDPTIWASKLEEDILKKNERYFKKNMRLFLVCALTHRLVPCGPLGQGYRLQHVRKWVKKTARVADMMLRITLASLCGALGAGLASTALSGAVGAAFGVTQEETACALRRRLERMTLGEGGVSAQCHQDMSNKDAVRAVECEMCIATDVVGPVAMDVLSKMARVLGAKAM